MIGSRQQESSQLNSFRRKINWSTPQKEVSYSKAKEMKMSRDFFQQTHKLLESEKVVTFVLLICSAIDFAMVSKDLSLFNLTLGILL